MATNNILPFCPTDTGTNLLTQVEYAAATDRTSGNKPGVASSKLNNKALRQAAFLSSQIAQYLSDKTGNDVLDDGNTTTLLATIVQAFSRQTFAAKTANYTVLTTDQDLTGDATGGAFTFTLPTAVGASGRAYTFKRINSGANAITIATTSAQTIDGASTQTLLFQYDWLTVESNGTNWIIVGAAQYSSYFNGYMDSNRSFSTTSVTLGNPTGLAAATNFNSVQSLNMTVTQFTNAGSWYPGISITALKTGRYEIIVTVAMEIATSSAIGVVGLWDDTSSVMYDTKSLRAAAANGSGTLALVGTVLLTANTLKTMMVQMASSSGTTLIASSNANVTRILNWSVKYIGP